MSRGDRETKYRGYVLRGADKKPGVEIYFRGELVTTIAGDFREARRVIDDYLYAP